MVTGSKFINLGISFLSVLKNHENENAVIFNDNEIYSYKDLNLYSEKIVKIFNKNNLKKKGCDSNRLSQKYNFIFSCGSVLEDGITYSFLIVEMNLREFIK